MVYNIGWRRPACLTSRQPESRQNHFFFQILALQFCHILEQKSIPNIRTASGYSRIRIRYQCPIRNREICLLFWYTPCSKSSQPFKIKFKRICGIDILLQFIFKQVYMSATNYKQILELRHLYTVSPASIAFQRRHQPHLSQFSLVFRPKSFG